MTEETPHPRPLLRRPRWTDLNGTWRFAFDDTDQGIAQRWFDSPDGVFDRTIEVPYPPESKLSGVADTSFHPVLWYERTFVAEIRADERLLLHFGAVDYRATVWVNGHKAGEHEGGHTPFTLDITEVVDLSTEWQTLVVRAEDEPTDTGQPRGKQTWNAEPSGIWYDRTSGIWQTVWLEPVPAVHIDQVVTGLAAADGAVDVEIVIDGVRDATGTVDVTLTLDGELHATCTVPVRSSQARCIVYARLFLPSLLNDHRPPILWTPESPTLFDVDVRLSTEAGTDEVTSYAGLREVSIADGAFRLNDRPYYLRMVLEQGFWPESHLAAPNDDALRREVELIKELGFTGVRIHQKVEDPRFLYWCDRLGLLVWGEMANAQMFSGEAADRFTREWLEVVDRDRGHPSVVTWVPLNESWGVPKIGTSARQQHYARGLYHLTKAIDPTRPVIANDGWEHTETDILGIHDYAPDGAGLRSRFGDADAVRRTLAGVGPAGRKLMLDHTNSQSNNGANGDGYSDVDGRPLVITEYGGLSYTPTSGQRWYGYRAVDSAEEFKRTFEDLTDALLQSPQVAGFCYTQLTDTMQERNGLLTEDREPKLPVEVIRDIVRRPSSAFPQELVDAHRRRAREAAEEGGPA
ncbi:glycoside hydrolase family 2 protein [Phytoactinopolyspora halotolerans]|uniref:glycoside hydrolase family 2 protein n=1 Tax=Phytoactinopolyspora halotolerans TaxID=1981512 RepID=UPI001C207180|nr:sugar-binding domain-containing protein [Phytoactinopolyspora halotolerans]